jgi:hypothetical protein
LGVIDNILLEIKEISESRGDTSFSHEWRESKFEADKLARLASSLLAI